MGRVLNSPVWHKAVTIGGSDRGLVHIVINKLQKFPQVSWKSRADEMPQLTRLQFWSSASSSGFSIFGCRALSTSRQALTVALPGAHLCVRPHLPEAASLRHSGPCCYQGEERAACALPRPPWCRLVGGSGHD